MSNQIFQPCQVCPQYPVDPLYTSEIKDIFDSCEMNISDEINIPDGIYLLNDIPKIDSLNSLEIFYKVFNTYRFFDVEYPNQLFQKFVENFVECYIYLS